MGACQLRGTSHLMWMSCRGSMNGCRSSAQCSACSCEWAPEQRRSLVGQVRRVHREVGPSVREVDDPSRACAREPRPTATGRGVGAHGGPTRADGGPTGCDWSPYSCTWRPHWVRLVAPPVRMAAGQVQPPAASVRMTSGQVRNGCRPSATHLPRPCAWLPTRCGMAAGQVRMAARQVRMAARQVRTAARQVRPTCRVCANGCRVCANDCRPAARRSARPRKPCGSNGLRWYEGAPSVIVANDRERRRSSPPAMRLLHVVEPTLPLRPSEELAPA